MNDSLPAQHIKETVGAYWHNRAHDYDDAPQHVVRTEVFERRWLELLERLVPQSPQRVLDVGAGTGFLSLMFASLGHTVISVDQSTAMLEIAQRKANHRKLQLDARVGDVEALPLTDSSVDVVAERHVLWTMQKPTQTLREWYRVLRPGGTLVHIGGDWSTLPPSSTRSGKLRMSYDEIADHLPLMGGAPSHRIVPLLRAAGFADIEVLPMAETEYWEAADPRHPVDRYVIRAARPRQ